jgi:hypothetical protein
MRVVRRCAARFAVRMMMVLVVMALGVPAASATQAAPWWRSADVIVDGRASADGYQLFTARGAERWAWRPLTTIQPGGSDEEPWVGYHCLAGSGRYVLAVIAPRPFVNSPRLRDRGADAYVVDVRTGRTRPLIRGVALKYHNPGCGLGNTAVLSRNPGDDQRVTELLTVDLARGRIVARHRYARQLTGAVPTRHGIVAAMGHGIVRLSHGRVRTLARVAGAPYELRATRRGVDFLTTASRRQASAWRLDAGRRSLARLGQGRLGALHLFTGRRGRSVLVGATRVTAPARRWLRLARSPSTRARAASLEGAVVLAETARRESDHDHAQGHAHAAAAAGGGVEADPALGQLGVPEVDARLVDGRNGRPAGAALPSEPSARRVTAQPRVLPAHGLKARAAVNTTTPKCAVPRNDLRRQVPQPGATQVNWAIQQATRNLLVGSVLTRPSNFANMGLASYQPSSDFTRQALHGASSSAIAVPPSVIQAVFAQENNWWQASRHALPGLSGNPAIADYYGAAGTLDVIDYDKSDCGYGLSQVTDYMTATSTYLSANGKAKVAVDYAENTAIGITFLVNKWNQLYDANVRLNDADPQKLENWYFALWAYNSGFNPNTGSGPWGLGWTNNPQNSDYPPDRDGFLRDSYADAAHPGDWPYQERVVGWMETPLLDYKGNASYAKPKNDQGTDTGVVLPGHSAFCTAANECSPSYVTGDGKDYCTRADRKCWWHSSATFASCATGCAHSAFTVATTATEPAAPDNYAPACSSTLPSNATIVDDQPTNLNVEGCGTSNWTSQGTFTLTAGQSTAGVPLGIIDTHQLGTGFGGHVYFTKNQTTGDTAHTNTGTWTPPSLSGVFNVRAHVPPSGATSSYASYRVYRGDGTYSDSVIDQHIHQNRWVSLGNYTLQAGAKVVLTNITPEPDEKKDVAFDAMAFTPVAGTHVTRRIDAVATFDDNQSLDTSLPLDGFSLTPFANMGTIYDWANGLTSPVASLGTCAGTTRTTTCVPSTVKSAVSTWRTRVLTAGNARQVPAPADTQPKWLHLSSPKPPIPLTDAFLADPLNYKIRSRFTIDYLQTNGVIDPTSVTVKFENRTGNTHLPDFVMAFFNAVRDDYGIPVPDLRYQAVDLNQYTHATTAIDARTTGVLPGRAYHYYSTQPEMQGTSCLKVRGISGGSIGYGPMLRSDAVRASAEAWKNAVAAKVSAGLAPQAVADIAANIQKVFFSKGDLVHAGPPDLNSPYWFAPAIWLQQSVKVCGATGGVTPINGTDLVDNGYMPDLYIFIDGQAVSKGGSQQINGPAQTGDFSSFSNPGADLPHAGAGDPWGPCFLSDPSDPRFISRRDGIPWDLDFSTSDDQSPGAVRLCDEDKDTRHSELG